MSTNGPETGVQFQVESYQRLKKRCFIQLFLTLSIIRYGSRVKWSNPGNGVAPSPTLQCCSFLKGRLRVTLDYGRQLYLLIKEIRNKNWQLIRLTTFTPRCHTIYKDFHSHILLPPQKMFRPFPYIKKINKEKTWLVFTDFSWRRTVVVLFVTWLGDKSIHTFPKGMIFIQFPHPVRFNMESSYSRRDTHESRFMRGNKWFLLWTHSWRDKRVYTFPKCFE